MRLPRILIIDDQYAGDPAEKQLFLRQVSAIEEGVESQIMHDPIAEVTFCSGQIHSEQEIINSYTVVRDAVASGQESEGLYWSLVMLDVRFDSGLIDDSGLPSGQSRDDHFGEEVLQCLSDDFPDLCVVMLSGKRQQELRGSETPYLSKDMLNVAGFKRTLLRYGRLDGEQSRRLLGLTEDIVAASESTLANFREAFDHSTSDVPVLVLGETGTGKEVLAKYIHEQSGRAGGYLALNVAAIPDSLLEAELFGIEKGTATGVDRRAGKLELANGGTLFLDEIGDMPVEAQMKVLRVLQEHEVYRVGGSKAIALDVRLICATSRDLASMIERGEFREDLFYRINTIQLTLAPLRQRREDVLWLVRALLDRAIASSDKVGIEFSPDAIGVLESHKFPGNIRELENIIRKVFSAAGNHQVIGREAVIQALGKTGTASPVPAMPSSQSGDIGADKKIIHGAHERMALRRLPEVLESMEINKDDESLYSAKNVLDAAYKHTLQRLAGAALERCRDPVSGKLNRQRSMQYLTGNTALKGKGPARVINEILGRRLEHQVEVEDLEYLVSIWEKAGRRRDHVEITRE